MTSRPENGPTGTFENEGVRVSIRENCWLCGRQGHLLYADLRDRLFDAPGVWSFFQCEQCGLVWLNPQPVPEDIGKLYAHYYTHEPGPSAGASLPAKVSLREKLLASVFSAHLGYPNVSGGHAWERIGKIARHVPLLRDWAGSFVMNLPMASRGRLLDVGCGNGGFLAAMREHGWQVRGVEPDLEAARVAREHFGLEVTTGTLEKAALLTGSIDAITLHHVIEHVPHPVALLAECCRVLRPGGKLVAVMPNAESLGHLLFKDCWRDLDPPRHLHLPTLRALQICVDRAGLQTKSLRSVGSRSRDIYIFSQAIRRGAPHLRSGYRQDRRVAYEAWAFLALEEALRLLNGKMGEELVLIAARRGDGSCE